jgi:hypothetical protein
LINVQQVWWKVEVLALYQVIAGEMAVRGRVQPTLNDSEPFIQIHNIATTPLLPGAPRLSGIPEGSASKSMFSAIRTLEPEPPSQDSVGMEMTRRYLLFQGTTFTVKGATEFPVGADPKLHRELLFKSRFFPVLDATLTVVGVESQPLQWAQCYVNRDLVVALYLS